MRYSIALLMVLALAATAVAQTPGMVDVVLPSGGSFVESTATSGTLSGNGITCTWTTGANSATFHLTGAYTTSWMDPTIDVAWFNTGQPCPMAVTFTSSGSGTYNIEPPFYPTGTGWVMDWYQSGMSGDMVWGNIFPPCERFDMGISLHSQSVAYDLTMSMEWGAGVATEPNTFGAVKSLFR